MDYENMSNKELEEHLDKLCTMYHDAEDEWGCYLEQQEADEEKDCSVEIENAERIMSETEYEMTQVQRILEKRYKNS